jgi:predicted dehydrogenase
MTNPLNILVVGVGSIGRRHIANLQVISESNPLHISVVDPHRDILDTVCREKGLRGYGTLEEAFSQDRYDASLICSPNNVHVSQAEMLLGKGSHLFVEKPLALDSVEAGRLKRPLSESGRFLMVGCNLRFHPAVRHIFSAMDEKPIGRPLFARAHFSHFLPNWRPGTDYRTVYSAKTEEGGGILLDAIHEPDYLHWLFGKVEAVNASLERLGDLEIDTEDVATYTMKQSGVLSQVHVDYLRRDKSRGCEIVGTEGTILWNSTGKNPEKVLVRLFDIRMNDWAVLYEDSAYDLNLSYLEEMKYFIHCIRERAVPMNGLEEAIHLMTVMDGIRLSSKTGQSVMIPGKEE